MAVRRKLRKVLHEFKEGDLHSGSPSGPTVTNPKQAVAIALNSQRKASGLPRRRTPTRS